MSRRSFWIMSSLVIVFGLLLSGGGSLSLANGSGNSLPSNYWQKPLATQGASPGKWSEEEASLSPQACQQCHPDKYREWSQTLHAKALSPGLVGQLVTYDASGAAYCLDCHAPLAEQKAAFERARASGKGHLREAQGLAAFGNSCAGCHVRQNRRFGPPQRDTGLTGPSDSALPHGGVLRTTDFEKSSFCKSCHQFDPSMAVNGKPLENTFAEWQNSPQARAGQTCQSCHMPDRRHQWRGIHDPDTVRDGLSAQFESKPDAARFTLTNSGVGHAFPTYVTPRVLMRGVALDASGNAVPETEVTHVIQRVVSYSGSGWVENSDTRLLPGESASLEVPWNGYSRIRVWLEVHPDDYYDHKVYDQLLAGQAEGSPAAMLISEADAAAQANRFVLFDTELKRQE